MGSKCHTDKHRRRRAREIQNKGQRIIKERDRERRQREIVRANRIRIEEAEEWAIRTRHEYWRQDPVRYALLQRLVNVINYKVQNDPLYRLQRISGAMRSIWGGLFYGIPY
jgi:uncharacterized membrane protein YqiK